MTTKGTKRKIDIMKRDTKEQRAVACTKRRRTLFSKAADLCHFSGANMAVFVTSPSDNSDVVYSFSGYSSASEIADCYLNHKPPPKRNPQSTFGFWWETPDLYHSCDDISTLNVIDDRLERTKKDLMACIEKKEKLQLVSYRDQNPSTASSLIVQDSLQNPSTSSFNGVASSQIVYDSFLNPNTSSFYDAASSQIVYDFFQNPNTEYLDQTQRKTFEEIYGELSSLITSPEQNSSSSCFSSESSSQIIYDFFQNSNTHEYLDQTQRKTFEEIYEELTSLITSPEQNSSSSCFNGESSSQIAYDSFDQNPNTDNLDQTPTMTFDEEMISLLISFEDNPVSSIEEIYSEPSSDQSGFSIDYDKESLMSLCETEKENNRISLLQETQMATCI